MSKRCPNGSRRNKKTGECEEHNKNTVKNQSPEKPPKQSTRCPKGTNKKAGFSKTIGVKETIPNG
jgi:hypothetical protein